MLDGRAKPGQCDGQLARYRGHEVGVAEDELVVPGRDGRLDQRLRGLRSEVPGGDQRPRLLGLADDLVYLRPEVSVRAEDRDLLALHHAARLEVRSYLLVVGGVAQVRTG